MKTALDTKPIAADIPMRDRIEQAGNDTLPLIQELCDELQARQINYCHWKSNNALDRSANGLNDLDLLIDRSDEAQFTEILSELGFIQGQASKEKWMPGVIDFFGYDDSADKLIHVHAHYQLYLGHDMTKNFRLPVENQYLKSTRQGDLFRTPAFEYEYIVFIIRMVLKHATWDAILGREGKLNKAESAELNFLEIRINPTIINEILNVDIPFIGEELFEKCVAAAQPDCPIRKRLSAAEALQTSLVPFARHSIIADIFLKQWRRTSLFLRRRITHYKPKYKLATGGFMLAVLGGDGSGKTTAVDGIKSWLSKHFYTGKIHMGKPTWSLTTRIIRSILKIGNLLRLYPEEVTYQETLTQKSFISPGYPWLIREVCRARDRYYTFRDASKRSTRGHIVILDRYPHSHIEIMDGPLSERFLEDITDAREEHGFLNPHADNRLVKYLIRREKDYYDKISSPDMMVVLRVEPEIAVQRKTDEIAESVFNRSRVMWELDWSDTDIYPIDAGRPKAEVLSDIKRLLWSRL